MALFFAPHLHYRALTHSFEEKSIYFNLMMKNIIGTNKFLIVSTQDTSSVIGFLD